MFRRDPGEIAPDTEAESSQTAFVEPEPIETVVPEFDLQSYSPSLELMKEAGIIQEIEQRPIKTSLSDKKSLSNIVHRLKMRQQGGIEADYFKAKEYDTLQLERIRQTSQAMFQVDIRLLDFFTQHISTTH